MTVKEDDLEGRLLKQVEFCRQGKGKGSEVGRLRLPGTQDLP